MLAVTAATVQYSSSLNNMKRFASIKDGVVTDITRTGGFTPPSRDGAPYIECPFYVQTGDTFADGKWFRDGTEIMEQEYEIPSGPLLEAITNDEFDTMLAFVFPEKTAEQRDVLQNLFRLCGQEKLKSKHPRVKEAYPVFVSLLGAARLKELLAKPEEP